MRKDGGEEHVMETVISVPYRGRRAVLGNFVIVSDIRRAQERLRVTEAGFRTAISNNPDGVVITDRKGIVRFINPAAEALLGWRADDVRGSLFTYLAAAKENAEINIMDGERVRATVELRVVDTIWEGEDAYLAMLRDITARLAAEQAIAKARPG